MAPAYHWVPPHVSSAGGEAIELAEMAGIALDPEQKLVVEAALAEDEHGLWAAFEVGDVMARQNGKTLSYEVVVLADLFLFDTRLVVWSAHHFSTAQEAFRDLEMIVDGTPEFSRRVKAISHANGDEAIELTDDRRLVFRARTATGGRGLTGDRVVLDEAFKLTAKEMGSLLPTMSARPNPQVLYGSSAGLVDSGILRVLRDRGRPGGDPSLAWLEWCAPEGACTDDECMHLQGTPGCAADDLEMIRRANPALERRITIRYVLNERRTLPPAEFVRERLGWWDEPAAGVSGIPLDHWAKCANREAELDAPVVVAFDVDPGHVSASIVACGDALHVVEHRGGTSWMLPRLLEVLEQHGLDRVGVDPVSPAAVFIAPLEDADITVDRLDNAAVACEGFLAGVLDHTLVHRDEQALNLAVEGAARRRVGDSWKWSRRDSSVAISPLVAATVARRQWVIASDIDMGEQVF